MKKENIALIVILAIQLIVYIFMGVQKSYIHMDEAYSIGLTNYDKVEITDNENFYGNWHNSAYYEDYLSISQEEVKDLKPVYENQKNDVHPPFYYLLLRIAYSFHLNEFSKWPGIILNIIIFICSNILIYKILTKIIKNKKIALLMCLVSGLVISSLESVTYIRMYALNSFILLAIAYLHILNYKKEELDIKNLILIGTATLIASLTHYYNIIYIGIIYLIYAIIYLKNKQYKNLRKYTLTMVIAAICSLAIFPYSIKHIFMGYRGQGVLETFKEPSKMISNLANYITILNEKVFNGTLWLIAIFLVGVCIFKLVKNKQITIKVQNEKLLLIIIPAIIYFLFVAVSSPYTEIRYIIPVCNFIFIFVIYELYEVINKILKEERNSDILISIILILILVMPLKTNAKIDNLYLQRKEIVSQVTEKYEKIPTIYLFNSNQNRFLDDIYMFTKINESYILKVKDASTEKVQEILQNKDISNGIVVWVNEGFEKKQYLEMIKNSNNFKNCEHIQRMNACDIYYIY
jgi:hypothetical protein